MKTFLITGASSGIGAATARMAVQAGYRVGLAARSIDRLESLAEELGGPEKAIAIACDVASLDDQQAMVEATLEGVRPHRRGVRQCRDRRHQARHRAGRCGQLARDGADQRARLRSHRQGLLA
jgi:NADPH:quinone reductase-like Zn-dependent oxidoreductase